jgi:exodeoxyribonuclease VIII
MQNPPTSEAMALGTLLHSMVLEPEVVAVAMPECDRRTKEGKAIWNAAAADAAAAGKMFVKKDVFECAGAMCDACVKHPAFETLFGGKGHNELSIFWTDAETDLKCKARADRVVEVPGFGFVCVDIKTTTDASPVAFARAVNRFSYHIQAAWYLDALALAGIACERFVILAVESSAPHCVAAYALDDDAMEQGRRDVSRLKREYAKCAATGIWPSYSPKIESLSLPKYAFDDEI